MIDIKQMSLDARAASKQLAILSSEEKNAALQNVVQQLESDWPKIQAANQQDVLNARKNGLSEALVDRLLLTDGRWKNVIEDFRTVIHLPDPVGEVIGERHSEHGMIISKVSVPLGVIAVIYEARPNVTVDVVGLCLKSGNAVILRGGKETLSTNAEIFMAIQSGLSKTKIPAGVVQFIADNDKNLILELMKQYDSVDMLIPRGGAGLHKFCRENSLIPVITGGIGICHLYVDSCADLERSIQVIRNAKIQRPSVCNALDTVLVHQSIAQSFIPRLVEELTRDMVEFRADPRAYAIAEGNPRVKPAGTNDFDTEWLSLVLGIRVVDTLEEAIEHIQDHSTGHSDGILSADQLNIQRFIREVDSAAVYVNASTRFTDGAQFGLGAEIAVSTQKMHARGPMALRELTSYKWIVQADYLSRP